MGGGRFRIRIFPKYEGKEIDFLFKSIVVTLHGW